MFWLVQILVPIALAVVLPVLIVWIVCRMRMNKDNKNAEIIIRAIESNSVPDTDKIVEALGRSRKSPREILQSRLLRGCIFTLFGIAAAISGVVADQFLGARDFMFVLIMTAGCSLAIGIAYLVVYFMTRKSVNN